MPLKLQPPRPGKTPYYGVRGTHVQIYVDRSTGTSDRKAADRIRRRWIDQIERGIYNDPRAITDGSQAPAPISTPQPTTFLVAALAYIKAGEKDKRLIRILKQSGPASLRDMPLDTISQIAIDNAADDLFPNATPQTKNREFYTPVAAVLHRAGIERRVKRPVGWKGSQSTSWLEPPQAFRLFAEADTIDREFGLLVRFLTYTGMRLGEALNARLRDLHLSEQTLYVPDTKTGTPRPVYLPPVIVDALVGQTPRSARPKAVKGRRLKNGLAGRSQTDAGKPFLDRRPDATLFRFHASGRLREMLAQALKQAGLSFPQRQGGFHLFCHTYGTWMHHYGELDTYGLVRTNRWRHPDLANRYRHTKVSDEARRADLLPIARTV